MSDDHCEACPFAGCESCRHRWLCAVVACQRPVGEPHVPECPYATEETR